MEKKKLSDIIRYGIPLIAFGSIALAFIAYGKGYEFSLESIRALFEQPCERPLAYRIGSYDERFGISRADFAQVVRDAAEIWSSEYGRTLLVESEEGFPVNLIFGERQAAANLGKVIDSEQQEYERLAAGVEELEDRYRTLRTRFEAMKAAYERRGKQYDEDVAMWNAKGGAPPAEYQRLTKEQQELKRQAAALEALADEINTLVETLNTRVNELNAYAAHTNVKVGVYNEAVGDEFDQGTYIEDKLGKRITIYEFTNRTELARVLRHEFGHAIGLGHVENPESIMYSYNIGSALALSVEDRAELARVCGMN
ncbi:MAG TPA: matrixin family metalloprotease [Candidatus Paceibacterota bacterium]|nr:matrixin family metalloprotease [Candidatus Paceibacterota bacterium]